MNPLACNAPMTFRAKRLTCVRAIDRALPSRSAISGVRRGEFSSAMGGLVLLLVLRRRKILLRQPRYQQAKELAQNIQTK